MKTVNLSWAMRSVAVSLLCNLSMPVAEAWAAEEIQVLRKAPDSVAGRVMPFTTFQQEEQAVANSLPCKWISKDGRLGPSYGNVRYDYLCKGGDFATVSLYLDKAGTGVGGVRLLYREWPVNTNPNAGEAVIAQQFLQHVAGRFVPAAAAPEVMDAFWAKSSKSWSLPGVTVKFSLDKGAQFNVRKLEIVGTGKGLALQTVTGMAAGLVKGEAPKESEVKIYGPDGKEIVPGDAGLAKPVTPIVPPLKAPEALPELALPVAPPPSVLPKPGSLVAKPVTESLVVPVTAPAGETESKLKPATPAELNTAPEPESKVTPVAPPELSATLVPTTADITTGGMTAKAPSNFDIYNKAVELTKDVEKKAQIARVDQAKVTASKPVTPTVVSSSLMVTPSSVVAPALKPVPTPGVAEGVDREPTTYAADGLVKTPVKPEEIGQPLNYNGPRSSEPRPLPQLKFVPKAEPLKRVDEVIQFEDEKSRL